MSIEKKKRKLRFVSIGKILTQLREERKMKQTEVAMQMRMSSSLLNKFERNQRLPSTRILKQLADIYEVNAKRLIVACLMNQILRKFGQEDYILEGMQAARKVIKEAESR